MASQRPTGNLVEIIERHGKDISRLKKRLPGADENSVSKSGDTMSGNLQMDGVDIILAGGGPKGLEAFDAVGGNFESRMSFRTNPQAWEFEDAAGADILRVATGGGTLSKGVYIDAELNMGGNTIDNILIADVNEVQADAGAVSDPSYTFRSDTDTGAYRRSTNQFSIATGGVHRALFYSGGLIVGQVATGDPRIQGGGNYSWHGDTDTYMDRASSNVIRMVSAGQNIALFSRVNSERGRITLDTAADTWIDGYRTGTVDRLWLHANDHIFSDTINNDTTSVNANLAISGGDGTTTGDIKRSTSSLIYKEGWEFADETALAQLTLPTPITWEDEVGGIMLGYGTEHVLDMLPAATQDHRLEDGVPENYDVRALVAILSAKVKRLEAALEL